MGNPEQAWADEGETSISASAAVSGFSIPDHSPIGGVLGGDYEYSISEAIWLRASAGGGVYYDSGSPAYAAYSHLGFSYVIDVFKYVPHIDLGIGGLAIVGDNVEDPILPLIEIGVGFDILTSRRRSHGIFARFESFLGRSAFFSVGVRTTWRSGFF